MSNVRDRIAQVINDYVTEHGTEVNYSSLAEVVIAEFQKIIFENANQQNKPYNAETIAEQIGVTPE